MLACLLALLLPATAFAGETVRRDRAGDVNALRAGKALDIVRVGVRASSSAIAVTVDLRGDFERAMRAPGMRGAGAAVVLRRRGKRPRVVATVGSGTRRRTLASVGSGRVAAVVRRGRRLGFHVAGIDAGGLQGVRVETFAPRRRAAARASLSPAGRRLRRLMRRRAADTATAKIDATGAACGHVGDMSADLVDQSGSIETDAKAARGASRSELEAALAEARTLSDRLLEMLDALACDEDPDAEDFEDFDEFEEDFPDPDYPVPD